MRAVHAYLGTNGSTKEGKLTLKILVVGAVVALLLSTSGCALQTGLATAPARTPTGEPSSEQVAPTLAEWPTAVPGRPVDGLASLAPLYDRVNKGVVLIQVLITRGRQPTGGTGSGFVLDDEGHIVTNHHVVSGADQLIVTFFDGYEARAEIVGMDDDSDLAVIKVRELPANVHPLPLGDLAEVAPGDWVVAMGSPFGLGSSMTVGIVSAVGRMIPTATTPFGIPEAIQTDAAINPGNSGGPLLNLRGEVVGVNAQIASQSGTSAGVGFAVPVSIVRRVVPVLIQEGAYEWPWLGIEGTAVSLLIQEANDLPTQEGAYISSVVRGGPAAEAGVRGTRTTRTVNGVAVPAGGDVVVAIDGAPVADFSALVLEVAMRQPGDEVTLTIVRGGEEREIAVTLAPRPQ